jgi:hypothetical protein
MNTNIIFDLWHLKNPWTLPAYSNPKFNLKTLSTVEKVISVAVFLLALPFAIIGSLFAFYGITAYFKKRRISNISLESSSPKTTTTSKLNVDEKKGLQLDANIKSLIENQNVDKQSIKNKLEENLSSIVTGYTPLGFQFDSLLPAFIQAEKTRMYFDSQDIPVAYTTRGFEDYVITTIIKNEASSDYLSSKRVKPLVIETREADLNRKDFQGLRDAFCLCSNLYDSSHGESHIFYLGEGTQSQTRPRVDQLEMQIRALLKPNRVAVAEIAKKIFSLYCSYNQRLKDIKATKLLHTAVFTNLKNNKDIIRLSKSFGYTHDTKPENINTYLLNCNQKTKLQSQVKDCPQLRAFKPAANKDGGIRMFRCYSSEEQKRLHQEFRTKLQVILGRI